MINVKRTGDLYVHRLIWQFEDFVSLEKNQSMLRRKAFWHRFSNCSMKERIRMLVKVLLRVIGISKPIYLGGYRREEDIRQQLQDLEIYCLLLKRITMNLGNLWKLENRKHFEPEELSIHIPIGNEDNKRIVTKIRKITERNNSYIVLLVENLDRGGLEEVVKRLAVEYQIRKISVKVFCTDKGGKIADDLIRMGIEVVVFNGQGSLVEKYLLQSKPLVVNSHNGQKFLDIFHRYGVPVVEVIHNMYVYLGIAGIAREQKKAAYISQYIAVSKEAEKIFRQKILSPEQKKITVIGNAVEYKCDKSKNYKIIRETYGIPRDAFVFLAAGRIDSPKNQIGMIRAWDIVRHLTDIPTVLVIAGTVTDHEYERKIKRLLEERNLAEKIIFTGQCEKILELMDASDAFLMNSYYEGWSMAASEALCSGLPLIHSRCGSGEELVAEGRNGILIDNPLLDIGVLSAAELYDAMHAGINHNMMQMVEAMLDVIEKCDFWKAKRNEIKHFADKTFSVNSMIEDYLKVYLDVCVTEAL